MSIEGEPPYRPPEEPSKQEEEKSPTELGREYEEAENAIQLNGITTTEALDSFLSIGVRYNRAMSRLARELPDRGIGQAEYYGEQTVKFMKAEQGTYTNEKATFCIGIAQIDKELADAFENGEWGIPQEERKAIVQQRRQEAANWLRMGAFCLETSEPEENR